MNPNQYDATQKMKTLSERVNEALARGYIENFIVIAKGLSSQDEKCVYIPDNIKIADFYRFEGYSDPQDNSILYLIETMDGRKGTLIDAYGAEADVNISDFIRDVEDIQKKRKD
ncbi:MAG: hypothetical protein JNM57_09030 [Cyclobacteriaceae bacterium]|nr:hypothetical protein [Cyclobacteriaceae bacterium]